MAQAARSDARRTFTRAQIGAIAARRSAGRRMRDATVQVRMTDPAMLAACLDAAGFSDHAAY